MLFCCLLTTWYSGYRVPPVYHFVPATGTLYFYDKMLLSYDVPVHMKNSHPKRGLNNLLPKSLLITWYSDYLVPPVYHFVPATAGTLYLYDKMLLSYDVPVHMKNSCPKKELKQFATKILACK